MVEQILADASGAGTVHVDGGQVARIEGEEKVSVAGRQATRQATCESICMQREIDMDGNILNIKMIITCPAEEDKYLVMRDCIGTL